LYKFTIIKSAIKCTDVSGNTWEERSG